VNETIEKVLSRYELVKEAVAIEPRIMQVFTYAAHGPYQSLNRWHEYEYCKAELIKLVGWGARDRRLTGCQYYESCVIAVDYLLPMDMYALEEVDPQPAIEGAPV
jgi:hypothetical protein